MKNSLNIASIYIIVIFWKEVNSSESVNQKSIHQTINSSKINLSEIHKVSILFLGIISTL